MIPAGQKNLSEALHEKPEKYGKEQLEWDRWEHITLNDAGKTKRIISCVHGGNSTLAKFITEAEKGLTEYPNHAFQAT